MEVYQIESNKLSWYKTRHSFSRVVDVKCSEDFFEAIAYAKNNSQKVYALGNGSNTFFKRKNIQTLILNNCLPKEFEELEPEKYRVSSSYKVNKLLRQLYAKGLDGPYNLASVPATVGGAVAMNAGTGKCEGLYIEKYIKEVTFWKDGQTHTLPTDQLEFGFRRSIFSEGDDSFIVSVCFEFPSKQFSENPILKRLDWAKVNQDLTKPNCGSVWRIYNGRLLKFVASFFRWTPAFFSKKSPIWITNESESPFTLRVILLCVRAIHRVVNKRCEEEIRIVD